MTKEMARGREFPGTRDSIRDGGPSRSIATAGSCCPDAAKQTSQLPPICPGSGEPTAFYTFTIVSCQFDRVPIIHTHGIVVEDCITLDASASAT